MTKTEQRICIGGVANGRWTGDPGNAVFVCSVPPPKDMDWRIQSHMMLSATTQLTGDVYRAETMVFDDGRHVNMLIQKDLSQSDAIELLLKDYRPPGAEETRIAWLEARLDAECGLTRELQARLAKYE